MTPAPRKKREEEALSLSGRIRACELAQEELNDAKAKSKALGELTRFCPKDINDDRR
jgi:hypothetical protein